MAVAEHERDPAEIEGELNCLFAAGGACGARLRARDWATHPLGPVTRWGRTLRTQLGAALLTPCPAGVAWGPNLLWLYNDACAAQLGGAHPRALAEPFHELPEEARPLPTAALERVMQSGQRVQHRHQALERAANGRAIERWYDVTGLPVRDEAGAIGGVHVLAIEVTQQVLAESRLALFEELSRTAAFVEDEGEAQRSVESALARASGELSFVQLLAPAGDGFEPILSVGDVPDRSWPARDVAHGTELLIEEGTTALALCVPVVWRDKRAVLVAGINPGRALDDGYWSFVRQLAHELGAILGRLQAFAAERQQLLALIRESQQMLRERDAELERANQAKDEFLTTLGHELRTPIAAILLWAEALRSGSVLPHEQRRAVEAIRESAKSQSRLIEDLLDLSRLTAGKLALSRESVAVEALARAARDLIDPMAAKKGITLELEIPADLGCICVDPARFQQVLRNLLSNAVKFTAAGGLVTLRARKRAGWLEVEVEDTGEGIAPEFMPFLFERFRQAAHQDPTRQTGLGVGLALSQQLIALHDGTIEAHSEGPGRGALFRVLLPPSAATPATQLEEPEVPPTPVPSLAGSSVLLVEDDRNTREAMECLLVQAGARVQAVASAAEALDALGLGAPGESSEKPELIVSDLGLVGMSGYELIERVAHSYRARGQSPPPACAVSAHARDVDRRRAIDAGFDLYVPKPVSAEDLVAAVQDLRDIAAATRT